MTDIPEVAFQKQKAGLPHVEVLTLQEVYGRLTSIQNHDPFAPHRVSFFLILVNVEGQGQHYIDFQAYPYRSGSLLFIAKNQVHAFGRHPENQGYLIMFTEAFLNTNVIISRSFPDFRLYNYHLDDPVIHAEDINDSQLSGLAAQMYDEYHQPDDFAKGELLRTLLQTLLLRAERIKHRTATQNINTEWLNIFIQFKNLLEQEYPKTRNARDYAQKIGISYKHLNEICKATVAKTAKQFIDHVVATEIKRYLASSPLSIKELSYKIGFDEPTNLVQFFKRQTHQTPTQFRKTVTG